MPPPKRSTKHSCIRLHFEGEVIYWTDSKATVFGSPLKTKKNKRKYSLRALSSVIRDGELEIPKIISEHVKVFNPYGADSSLNVNLWTKIGLSKWTLWVL